MSSPTSIRSYGVGVNTFEAAMLPGALISSIRMCGDDYVRCACSARGVTSSQVRANAGAATTSTALDCTAYEEPSVTRATPSGGGAHNAAAREATGKPCAGNPHARFERGSCSLCPRFDE